MPEDLLPWLIPFGIAGAGILIAICWTIYWAINCGVRWAKKRGADRGY